MKHFEQELNKLQTHLTEMWQLVRSQVSKSKEALQKMDTEPAYEIIAFDKKVNAFELVIDQKCENLIALYNPVAIDLRFVLSCYKINASLERIGDYAKSIAEAVVYFSDKDFDKSLIIETRTDEMFTQALEMMDITQRAFQNHDTKLASKIFAKDHLLDEINHASCAVLASLILQQPAIAEDALHYSGIIRKIERIGDYCKNISEEIVFFLEAKVLKHQLV